MFMYIIKHFIRAFRSKLVRFWRVYKVTQEGASFSDPSTVEIRGTLAVERGVSIDRNVVFDGRVDVMSGAIIESNCYLKDCVIGAGVAIRANSVLEGCVIEMGTFVGPFARIRPNTNIGKNAQIGNFVEIKNSSIGDRSKINHLAFIGDTRMGRDVIIGAGTITCNFDGKSTQETIIGDGVFVGSGVFIVAPVSVGEFSTIGTGSVITDDVPRNKLTIARSRQVTIDGWTGPNSST